MATKKEAAALLAAAKRAGRKWAQNYLDSDDFQDHVASLVNCRDVPAEDLPRTKKQAERVARNIIADFWNDTQRSFGVREVLHHAGGDVRGAYNFGSEGWFESEYGYPRDDLISAWWDGARAALFRASVRGWLGAEIKFRAGECAGG